MGRQWSAVIYSRTELSPVDNRPWGTGPAFLERFRYEAINFKGTSLSIHFDLLLGALFHWLSEWRREARRGADVRAELEAAQGRP
jgi:hypothetical protein